MSTVEMEHEDPVEDPQEPVEPTEGQDPEEETTDGPDTEDDADTFPRAYVEKIRQEAADARVRAKDRDTLATALWTAHVTATGRLQDPTDLPLPDDADPLDTDAVTTAVDDLLGRKPHLASRRPRGDVGAGASPVRETVDLAGILRQRA